ncbi:MAG: hypothetical protein ACK5JT_07265 [Hyphomicrobiaceae bacterium]
MTQVSGHEVEDPIQFLDVPQAWRGCDMASREAEWSCRWSDADVAELSAAADHVLALGKDMTDITSR